MARQLDKFEFIWKNKVYHGAFEFKDGKAHLIIKSSGDKDVVSNLAIDPDFTNEPKIVKNHK